MEEMEVKHLVQTDDSVVSDHKWLRIFVRPIKDQRVLDITVCDAASAIESTEFVIGQVGTSTGQSFGFGDSLLEMQMLQTM